MIERTLFDVLDQSEREAPKSKPRRCRRSGVAPDSGPETSREAADRIAPLVPALTAVVFHFIAQRGESGATDFEVQAGLSMTGDSERPRRWELQRRGLVCDSGARRKSPSGRSAIVYVATGRGLPVVKTQAG